MKIEVYDPAMCCSTGVCGPSVDPALATFAADLDWLAQRGVEVRRFNLGQEPGAFAEHDGVRGLLQDQGEAALPVVYVDGEMRSSGRYPSRDELSDWTAVATPTVSDEVIRELAAIGAAIGANCEPCFKHHSAEARKLGLSNADLALAVATAQAVKMVPAGAMLETAARLLHVDVTTIGGTAPAATDVDGTGDAPCCGGSEPVAMVDAADATAPTTGCC
jgi:AhpD family alkylhydroperoxidase